MLQSFHWYTPGGGFLYEEIKNASDWLQELGITSVWFPPAYKAANGEHSVGYDPYDLYDLGEFDQKGSVPTKYGTKEAYVESCKTLQSKGISIIADIVVNHKAGGDETERFTVVKVDENDRNQVTSEPFEIESFTKFTFPGRGNQYSDFEWNFTCFSAVDFAVDQEKAIYRIVNEHSESWEDVIGDEKGNYDYLMYNDINHQNPHVREELNHWAKWYHDQIFFDGVRLDAVKHQSPIFYKEWLTMLRSNTGKNIFAVGEYWAPGILSELEKYIEVTEGCMSLFDAPLHHNFYHASLEGAEYDMRQILADTLVSKHPTLAVTLVENHDTQPMQELEAPIEPWFKSLAYALILLRKDGLPCVFYPDLFGASYWDKGDDGNDYEVFLPKVDGLEGMLYARKHFAYGDQEDYFDDPHCIGWVRHGDADHAGCVVMLSNENQAEKCIMVGPHLAGKAFRDLLGRYEHEVFVGEDGTATFSAPAGNVSVWVLAEVL